MVERERWRRIEELFGDALGLEEPERGRMLAAACEGDGDLRREVEALLESDRDAPTQLRQVIGTAACSFGVEGRLVGRYRLLRMLGAGGMGSVYLAERDDDEYRHRVAVKVLTHGMQSPALAARLRDERQMLAALSHPGIVRLLDGGHTDDGLPYLVMEYVDGTPLAVYARGCGIRARVALVIAVAEALEYAHQRLVVHRDVKPSNILIDRRGAPKLLDFGIAKLLAPDGHDAREARTQTGGALFTIEYASPEQARGLPVSVATDVYSLGAVLYELLVGAPPQRARDNLLDTLADICSRDPVRPGALRRELAGDLDSIVLKALHKDPAHRYPSCARFADDLRRYLEGLPVSAREATFGYRAGKLVVRHRGKLAVATLVAAALTAVTVISIEEAGRADREAARATGGRRRLLVERGREELANGYGERALPFLAEAVRAGEDTPAVRFLLAEALRPIQGELSTLVVPEGVSGIRWSPDGDSVAVLGVRGTITITDRDGYTRSLPEPITTIELDDTKFAPDGRTLFAANHEGILAAWDVATGRRRFALGAHRDVGPIAAITGIAFAADGNRVLTAGLDGRVGFWDQTTGAARSPIETGAAVYGVAVSPDSAIIAAGTADGGIVLYDGRTGARVGALDGHAERIERLEFARDGAHLYSASADGTTRIWNVASRASIAVLRGGNFEVDASGRSIATGAADGLIRIWDAATGALTKELVGHSGEVRTVRWHTGETQLASAGGDGTFRIWDLPSAAASMVVEAATPAGDAPHARAGAIDAAFSPQGDRWVTAAGTVVTWRRVTAGPRLDEIATGGALMSASESPDGARIATSGVGVVSVWSVGERRRLWTAAIAGLRIYDVTWSHDGQRLAVAGEPDVAAIYDADGRLLRRMIGHQGTLYRVRFSPDGARIATAGADHTARVWDASTGAERLRLPHPDRVLGVAWSHDGTRIATAGWDHHLRIWDARTGAQLGELEGRASQFLDVSFAPGDGALLSAGHGGDVEIWNLATGGVRRLEGHTGAVSSAAWSPDGDLIATAGVDGTARVWDAATATQLAIRVHGAEVTSVAWAGDGRRLVTSCVDGAFRLWDARRDGRPAFAILAAVDARARYQLVDERLERRPGR